MKLKTAKEILIEHGSKNNDGMLSGQMKWILEAMEEYASQAYGEGYKCAEELGINEVGKYQDKMEALKDELKHRDYGYHDRY